MKILVVCQYYYPEPFRIKDICESLVKRNHQVTVLTGLPNYPEGIVLKEYRKGKKRHEIINGVEVIRCFEIGRGKGSIRRILNYLSFAISGHIKAKSLKKDYDVVFLNQLSPITMGYPAISYKKKTNANILLYCLDLWPASLLAGGIQKSSPVYKILLNVSKKIYLSADKILVSSSMFIDYLNNLLDTQKQDIKHLPQYAEDLFSSTSTEKLSNKKSKYNFVFAGNIGDIQSVDTIINAANILNDNKDILFHIVGDGSSLTSCKSLAEEMNLKNVVFYGRRPVNEMPSFYQMADALLITLKDKQEVSYTLPGKIQSYMIAKKPIIGAANGEIANVIKDAECGLCTNAEDYKEFAEIIKQFCLSQNKEMWATNAYKYYKDNYNKNLFIEQLEESLKQLVK